MTGGFQVCRQPDLHSFLPSFALPHFHTYLLRTPWLGFPTWFGPGVLVQDTVNNKFAATAARSVQPSFFDLNLFPESCISCYLSIAWSFLCDQRLDMSKRTESHGSAHCAINDLHHADAFIISPKLLKYHARHRVTHERNRNRKVGITCWAYF